jgi:nitrate reductase gamma subunit
MGRRLFDGLVRFADGRPPCSSCHTARGSTWVDGGSLGPDLSTTYLDYQDMRSQALFAVFPYATLALFAAGILIRYLLIRPRSAAATDGEDDASREMARGVVWRAGVALLFLGHLLGAILPKGVLAWNTSPGRLYAVEAAALAAGVAALLGWSGLLRRHLTRTAGSLSAEFADAALLSIVGVALASGLLTALLHRRGSSWGVITLTPYARSILRGRPLTELASQLPYVAQLHVAAAFAALVVLPWTRLGGILVVGLHRALRAAGRPIATAALATEAWLRRDHLHGPDVDVFRNAGLHNPAHLNPGVLLASRESRDAAVDARPAWLRRFR